MGVELDDAAIAVDAHRKKPNIIKELTPAALARDDLAREPGATNQLIREIPTHGGNDEQEGEGVRSRESDQPEIGRDDEQQRKTEQEKATRHDSRLTLSTTPSQPDRRVDENCEEPDVDGIAKPPPWRGGSDTRGQGLPPRQQDRSQLGDIGVGDPDSEPESNGQYSRHRLRNNEPTAGGSRTEIDEPRQTHHRGAEEESTPCQAIQDLLGPVCPVDAERAHGIARHSHCRQ